MQCVRPFAHGLRDTHARTGSSAPCNRVGCSKWPRGRSGARDPIAAAAGHAGRAAHSRALCAHAPRGPTKARRRAIRPRRASGSRRTVRHPGADPRHVVRMARFRGRGARTGTRTTPHRTDRATPCRSFPAPRPLLQLTSTTAPRHITMVSRVVNFKPLAPPVGEEEDL